MRLWITVIFALSLFSCKSITQTQDSEVLNYEMMSLCDDLRSEEDCRLREINSECGLQQKCIQKQKIGEQDISGSKADIWLCSCE